MHEQTAHYLTPENYVTEVWDPTKPVDLQSLTSKDLLNITFAVILHEGSETQPSLQDLIDKQVPPLISEVPYQPRVREEFSDEARPIEEAVIDRLKEAELEFNSARSEDSLETARSQIMIASRLGVLKANLLHVTDVCTGSHV